MSPRKKGFLVTISGPDGSGKSTQIELLKEYLENHGHRPVVLWTRLGYTAGFERAKALVRGVFSKRVPERGDGAARTRLMQQSSVKSVWLAAASADLLFTYGVQIRLLTILGRAVICDRYVWDALIDRRMFYSDAEWVDSVIRRGLRIVGKQPDVRVLLSLPYELASERSAEKAEPFPDPPGLREARHRLYEALANDESLRVVDASRSPGVIADEIVSFLPRQ